MEPVDSGVEVKRQETSLLPAAIDKALVPSFIFKTKVSEVSSDKCARAEIRRRLCGLLSVDKGQQRL